jgi:hypothetical protein
VTSPLKVNANRLNGRKSRGPKTPAGKTIASRNALRHGLAATKHHKLILRADVAVLAMGLCGNDQDPALFRQAEIIAENAIVLRAIEQQQVLVIERLCHPSVGPLSQPNNTLHLMKERVRQEEEARASIILLRDALLKKYEGCFPAPCSEDYCTEIDELFPAELEEFLKQKEALDAIVVSERVDVREAKRVRERDEGGAIEKAINDLSRLERYEKRTASRMQRAIHAFVGLKRDISAAGAASVRPVRLSS